MSHHRSKWKQNELKTNKQKKLAKSLQSLNCKDCYHIGRSLQLVYPWSCCQEGDCLSTSPPDKQGGQRWSGPETEQDRVQGSRYRAGSRLKLGLRLEQFLSQRMGLLVNVFWFPATMDQDMLREGKGARSKQRLSWRYKWVTAFFHSANTYWSPTCQLLFQAMGIQSWKNKSGCCLHGVHGAHILVMEDGYKQIN